MGARACIFGCAGTTLSAAERQFFAQANPWGFILFARNIDTPDQLRRLTSDLRDSVGRNAPILIDQEGGRVARMKKPHWREWPAPLAQMESLPAKQQTKAMQLRYRIIAEELHDIGIDTNCAPMLDIARECSHDAIKNRCYGYDADTVTTAGRAVANGLLAGGVLPIIKHIPGHGRTTLDSHHDLPTVNTVLDDLRTSDFAPFANLSDLPMAMTAHIIYTALDPENCATFSDKVIRFIRSDIGFDGLLMSDDLSMHALSGKLETRAGRALDAGCDIVLHCNGDAAEMAAIGHETPMLDGQAAQRAQAALSRRDHRQAFDIKTAEAELHRFIERV